MSKNGHGYPLTFCLGDRVVIQLGCKERFRISFHIGVETLKKTVFVLGLVNLAVVQSIEVAPEAQIAIPFSRRSFLAPWRSSCPKWWIKLGFLGDLEPKIIQNMAFSKRASNDFESMCIYCIYICSR
jgi:hypothetical protein